MTKVLIVEDNLTLLEDISLELDLRGYDVVQATDGKVALNILEKMSPLPDIIVSDIAMPDMDGFKFLETIRGDTALNDIPFLFLTASNSPNSLRISKELGADDFIAKPFQSDDLVLAIENKIKRIKAFQKKAESNLNESKRQLMQMISHELRSPLTVIYGGTNILTKLLAGTPDETVEKMIGLVQNGANRLNSLTKKIVALLEIDSGGLQTRFDKSREPFNMNELVESRIAKLKPSIIHERHALTIIFNPNPESVHVDGVLNYLELMIDELVDNAINFTPKDGTITVSVSQQDDKFVTLIIEDTGVGIPKADMLRLWERFVQINRDNQEQQGSGIGLSIVRDCARIHGGDCTLISELGKGTTVTLILPKSVL
ncbi:MAG: ATP-binding protein [Phototrophicales bacterium]|nr:ATP-binding protein [Phototrophicales bacterium]